MEDNKSLTERIVGWPSGVKYYVQELQAEMRRVTWPAWKQVRATTGVVILAVFAFAAYFWVVDSLLGRAMTKLFDSLSK